LPGIINSIVIVNFNNKPTLLALLKSLRMEEATGTEVILVDSASFDGSVEMVAEQYPFVKILQLKTNRGFFAAANKGLDNAEGDIITVCHADVVTDVHALAELADQCREAEARKVAAVVPRLVGVDDQERPMVGSLPGLGACMTAGVSPKAGFSCKIPFLDHVAENEWARCVCAAFNRNLLANIGTFDEKFFLYAGDADICKRIHAKQHRILISKSVKVAHSGTTDLKQIPSHLVRILAKDEATYAEKHLPTWQQAFVTAAQQLGGLLRKEQ